MFSNPDSFVSRSVNASRGVSRDLVEKIIELPRNIKQACLLTLDMVYVAAAMWGSLRWGDAQFGDGVGVYAAALAALAVSAVIFLRLGLYRAVIRFMGQQAIWAILTAVTYSALVFGVLMLVAAAEVPRWTPFIYWGLAVVGVGGTRLVVRAYYQAKMRSMSESVIIYGAGQSGRQLLHALQHGEQYHPVVFVDDERRLHRSVINGLHVAPPEDLEKLIERYNITQVLLAVPSASPERRREIIDSLVGLPVHVRTVPTINELLAGEASVNQIRDIDLDDLLGRDPVPPNGELIERCITDKVVMVTGAGGSIGSELCRQIIHAGPSELVLLDNSEYALYSIERELREMMIAQGLEFELVPLLGSVQDQNRLEKIYRTFDVDTV
ncbi:MAG: polysaccharide biosynthesis protein, partial [Halioglobus sp.]|nr:polysaccharide biosynthesis protein [Halioglobus sp.]